MFCNLQLGASPDSSLVLKFSFNEGLVKEDNDRLQIKPVGVTLTEDRFGNERSAVYAHGHASSYINFGTSGLLKPKTMSLSFWVKVEGVMETGKGYKSNPFFIVRNGPAEDFNMGYHIGYNFENGRIGGQATKDTILETVVRAGEKMELNKWYHLVLVSDFNYLALYVNGALHSKAAKNFETIVWEKDSLLMGRLHPGKNERFTNAIFDDIKLFHRSISQKEVEELFNEPDPNERRKNFKTFLPYGLSALFTGLIIFIIVRRNKKNFLKQKEYFELSNRIKELEIKVIKNQMNPHFISNCLSAIQNLIYSGEVDMAGEYIAKFSFFMRQVLEFSEQPYISLANETALIKMYIELEQLRFKNKFGFQMSIDNEIDTEKTFLPSLITQPIIENAIWHGLLPLKERHPLLKVCFVVKNSLLQIEIEDNGVGRSVKKDNGKKNSHGNKLVRDKLDSINRLASSNEYKLEIHDLSDDENKPSGTRVVIYVPLNTRNYD